MRAFGSAHPGKGAGSHAIAEPDIGHGDAFVQSLARAHLEAGVVLAIQADDAGQLGPKEGAVGKHAAANDGVTSIPVLAEETLRDRWRIVLEIDAIGPFHPKIVMMDQRVVAEAHFTRDRLHQRDEVIPCRYRPKSADDSTGQRQAERCFKPNWVRRHSLMPFSPSQLVDALVPIFGPLGEQRPLRSVLTVDHWGAGTERLV